ncbi:MFS transporter [Aeromicrobium sp. 9AM]|uniref:MFS transporter n=1 Tax=Aeromicrobium sp. 9AM TaxID=2653126 RepID=UPI0012F2B344|nr:MFS transporter [Aeromicrobium sp. 9AM]VXC42099.1 Puromycin resistance protein pur8 [Aeromicrobium sp. 9AM]
MSSTTAEPSVLATSRGKLILILLCAVGFLDLIDVTIVNVALPAIRDDLGFSVQELQWVPSAYLLTYGGFMLLGGRAADLLGRRRVLVAGITLFGIASLVGGFADTSTVLVGARLVQGVGAALTIPATLSIITTTFTDGPDRHKAFGAWAAVGGLASAVGVLLGGVLTEGPGWRWVMFINPVICAILLPAIYALIPDDRPAERRRGFDLVGTVLATGAMLLLVYTLVEAPDRGWDATRTIAGLAGTVALTASFIWVESRTRNPLVPFTIFQVRGLAAANITQFVAFAGFISMFFFLSLYMQGILGFSPIQTGLAYLPVCVVIGVSAGIATALIAKVGTRVLVVTGGLITAAGVYLFSYIRVDGSYVSDLLPGMIVMSLGIGLVFVALINAANAGVPEEQAGLAAALLNSSQQVGGALGLAVLSAIATSRTNSLLEAHTVAPDAMVEGFQRGLLVGAIFLAAGALIGLRTTNTHELQEAAA